jgi:hypothetical protein
MKVTIDNSAFKVITKSIDIARGITPNNTVVNQIVQVEIHPTQKEVASKQLNNVLHGICS